MSAAGRNADEAISLVLDAMGGVLSALSRYPLDLPQRPADESAKQLSAWQRHATMGLPVDSEDGGRAVGIVERDWSGLVRAVSEQRREEHRYVESAIGELRDALWACVETVHKAVRIENITDQQAESQMERARVAITRLQTGSIKQEVLGAVTAIESALQTRRDHHRDQYTTLASKLDKLGRQLEEARKESTTDPLTGVGNRKLFDIMGPRAIQLASLGNAPVALLMIDLDKLKMVNDMYGHLAGDAFITGVAKCLSKVFMRQTDVVCRYGGDEFAVILNNTESKVAQSLADRLMEHVAEMPPPHPAMEFQVAASVGIALLETHEELEHWVARADKALYKAKQNGTSRVCVA
jgi:diguanylate cyclase (GGDEF)-like protein